MRLLITSLTSGAHGLNLAELITMVVVIERFFFFLATERETFSILLNVDFTFFDIVN